MHIFLRNPARSVPTSGGSGYFGYRSLPLGNGIVRSHISATAAVLTTASGTSANSFSISARDLR